MSPRALIIEDSRTQARQLADLLEREGFSTHVEPDGARGLASCAAERPDVVLCDIVMPGIDGFEVCRRLRERESTRDLPIMLMTALADTADVMRALSAGADNFVTKPYAPEQLVARVRRMLAPRPRGDAATVDFLGQRYAVSQDPARVLDLLLSSLETMAERNVELERSRAAAEQALDEARHAVAARDEVIAVVSHDLRGPLNTVQMSAQLAQAEMSRCAPEAAAPALKRLATITRSAERMSRLVVDLLDVTRLEAGALVIEPEEVPLAQLFDDALQSQRTMAEAGQLELRSEADDPDGRVRVDRERVLQVLANLLGNAVKFTAPGGAITLGAARDEAMVRVTVRDTGAGIAAEELPHVFDRFWQARRTARKGTGLGLAIARGLVEAHGGRMWVESEQGVGTAMHFTLPRA